jgi:hypothetical protein
VQEEKKTEKPKAEVVDEEDMYSESVQIEGEV